MVLLAINTGVRQGELFGLTVECVNLTVNSISIEGSKAKSGKTRHIPLNLEAQNILKDWLSHRGNPKSGLVFPNYDGKQFDNVKRSWAAVLKEAKIETFRWHDMRHHFASRLVMVGVDLNTVRELLGHSSLEMTLRYAHLSPEIKAEAVSRLERRT
jgi:integrase